MTMDSPTTIKPDTTAGNPAERQVNGKTAIRSRSRSSVGTLAYWRGKLFRNGYTDRHGRKIEIPEYYVRMRHESRTRKVRLRSSDKELAADEALALSLRLAKEGWSAVDAGLARMPSSPSIDDFCEAYKRAAASMENRPRPITVALYLRHLRQIATLAGVSQIRDLTPETIERARDKYRARARAANRPESGIQNSLGIMIRNAAACFSVDARAILSRHGLATTNPFTGIKRTQKIDPVTALPRETVDRIWTELALLRNGDPNAAAPDMAKFRREYRKIHEGRNARRMPIDFRLPHPCAYCAILLALGLGLRANEIDKARWSWLKFGANEDCFLEIREETDFKPKGGTMRLIRIPANVRIELEKSRTDLGSPYILGGQESMSVKENGWGYRCGETLRVVNTWLRERGVESEETRGNPLHRLRKQFGSHVATEFGLFAAQKLLGHSSPTVTAKYYAAQTELPELTHVRIVG